MIALVSVFVALVGLVLWSMATGKGSDAGRIMFACGLLVFLFSVSGHSVKLF